jgi:hypothetical protein
MSKVEAYYCDYGGHLMDAEHSIGVKPIEDLLDKIHSYPIINNPAKAEIHFCLKCYREKVLVPASNLVDRRRDEKGYKLKVNELAFGLRSSAVFNWRNHKRKL